MYRGEPTKSFVEISTLIAAFDSAKGILLSAFGREVENSSGSEGEAKKLWKDKKKKKKKTLRKRRSWKLILKEFETVCLPLSDSSKRVQKNDGPI